MRRLRVFMLEIEEGPARPPIRSVTWADVRRWRKAERERLIEARLAHFPPKRAPNWRPHSRRASMPLIGDLRGAASISLYWPFRGEPDLRPWVVSVVERGGRIALPVVDRKGPAAGLSRLSARRSAGKRRLEHSVPAAGGGESSPDVVIAPLVGFDPQDYRLGYGGGFFDRTLASLPAKPLVIGVGYAMQAIPTIFAQPHDIAMDRIVTEAATMLRLTNSRSQHAARPRPKAMRVAALCARSRKQVSLPARRLGRFNR